MRQPTPPRRSRFSAAFLKRLSSHLVLSTALTIGVAGTVQLARAAAVYWDADGVATGNDAQTGAGLGGVGTWNTSTALWWPGTGATDFAWNNGALDTAIFTGSGAGISLGSDVVANGLVFSGSGYSIAGGANTLTLDGVAPTILVSTGGTLATVQSSVILNANAVLGGAGDLTLDTGVISGAAQGITKVGTGTLTLGGANTFGGAVALRAGVTSISAANNLGNGTATNTLTLAGGTLRATSSFNLGVNRGPIIGLGNGTIEVTGANNLTVDGTLSVAAGLTGGVILNKTGTGTLILTGTNSGAAIATTVTGGTVSIASNNNLGSGRVTLNGGTLLVTASTTLTNGINLGTAGGTISVASGQTFQVGTNVITGPGALTKTGTGTLQLNVANSYAGATTISAGTLTGGIASFLPLGTQLTVDSTGTLNLNNFATTVASIAGGGVISNTGGTATALTLGNVLGSLNTTFSGSFNATTAANLTLTKTAGGTLTIISTTPGTANGAWTLNAGTVKLDYAQIAGSGNILTSRAMTLSGGTLEVQGRSGATVTQGLGAITIGARGGHIIMTPNGGTSTTLALGTLTHPTTAGASLLVSAPATTAVTTTTTTLASGIFGGRYIFTDGTNYDWATNGGVATNPIAGLAGASYAAFDPSAGTDTANSSLTGNSVLTGIRTTNTLKIAPSASGQSLDLATFALNLTSGGLLFTGSNAYTITGTTGTLQSNTATTGDLIIHQYGTGALTIGAIIKDGTAAPTALTKTGPGTLVLSNSNLFTGAVFVNGGTLSVSSNSALGNATASTAITLNDGATFQTTATFAIPTTGNGQHTFSLTGGNATFDIAPTTTLTLGGVMSGAGGLTLSNTGTLIIPTAATLTGPINVNAGTLQGGVATFINSASGGTLTVASGALVNMNNFTLTVGGIAGAGNIVNGGATGGVVLTVGGNNLSTTYSGILQATGTAANLALTKNGSGVLTLTNNNLYTGATLLNYGTIKFGTNNALAATPMTVMNAATQGIIPAVLDLDGYNWTANAITMYGTNSTAVSQASINIGTGGTLTLGGAFTLTVNATASNGFQPAFVTGGTIDLGSATRSFAIADSINAAVDLTVTSVISSTAGTFGINKTGAGTLLLTGANTYTGTTTVNGTGGVLALGGAGTLGASTAALTMTAGTLDLNGTNQNVGTLSGAAAGLIRNGVAGTNSIFSIGNGNAATAQGIFAGNLTDGGGTLSLVKNGDGATLLTGTNSHSGGTQVNAGFLSYGTTSAKSATGTTQVAAGATLALGVGGVGFFSLADVDSLFANTLSGVNLAAGANVGIDTTAGDFDYTTNQGAARGLVKLGTNVLTLSGNNSYTGGTIINGGTLSFTSDSNLGSSSGSVSIISGGVRVTGTSNPTSNRAFTVQGASTFDIVDSANTYTISSTFGAGGVLTKTGAGALTLSGTVTSAANILVTGGALNLTGTVNGSPTATILAYGTAAGNSIVNVSGDLTLFGTKGANVAGAVSVYNQTAGTVTITPGTGNGQYVSAGGGYGYFNLTGGTYKASTSGQRFTVTAGASTGVAYIGGTSTLDFTSGEHFLIAYNGTGVLGQFTVADSALVNRTGASQNMGVFWTSANGYGVVNVAGGTLNNSTRALTFGGGAVNTATGFVNLAGGTLAAGGFVSNTSTGTGNTSFVNFAGGTYQATNNHTLVGADGSGNVITTTVFGAINNAAAGGPSFNGGAVIDTNGFAVTANRSLAAASGFGVTQTAIAIPATGNSGYIGAPAVQFSAPAGGGVPATGYALISGGMVTGIVITNPGTYASGETPTITLTGGGGTVAPFTTSALTTANGTGGLTKTGNGTLTLSAINTFSGATTVNGGILSVAPGALPNTSALLVGSTGNGTFDLFQDNVGAAFTMAGNAGLTLGGASTVGTLGLQLGTASDSIALSGTGGLTINLGGGLINVQALTGFGVGTYDLITGASSVTGFANLRLGTLPTGYSYSLSNPSGKITLTVGTIAAGDLYWTGDNGSSWATVTGGNSNWSTTANGLTDPGNGPGAANVVYFSATNAGAGAINTTLDSSTSVQGLKFINSGTGAVTIASGTGGSLTVGTDGIEVQTGAPATTTITAPVVMGSAQTWRVADSGSLLTLSGIVSGGVANSSQASPGTNVSLTITGAGSVAISNAANTFTGDILVDGGTLIVSNDRSWGGSTVASTTSKTVTLTNGGKISLLTGTVNPGATTTTNYNLVQIGAGGGTIDVASGATFQLDDTGQLFGSGTLTKTGLGILALRSQATTYTGNLLITAGTLQMTGTSGGFGNATGTTTISAGAALNLNGQATTDVEPITINGNGLAAAPAGAITNTGSTAAFVGPITLGSDASVGSTGSGTMTLSGGITGAFGLTIRNNSTGATTLATAAVNNGGSISNVGTGTGATTISAVIGSNVTSVIQNSTTSSLTLGGVANLWSGGLVIKAGVVNGGANANTFGANSNVITLGDTTGNADTTLVIPSTNTYAQPIQIAAGNTGIATINGGNTTGNPTLSGGITLNSHDLTLTRTGTAPSSSGFVVSGPITSTGTGGNLIITNVTTGVSTVGISLQGSVNHLGSITNNGNSVGNTVISGVIGGNVTNITQNSATSMLVLSGANSNFAGSVTISDGILQVGNAAGLNVANTVTIGTTGTLNVNQSFTIAGLISGSGATVANTSGTARTLTLGGSGANTFGGSITSTTPANLALTVALTGNGSQTLTGNSTYTGATTINQGTLILNFDLASTNSNILAASNPLILGGGSLGVIGDALASTQTFASTTLTGGTSSVISATADVGGLTLNLGAFTRNLYSSLNVNLTGNPTISTSGLTSSNGVAVSTTGAAFLTLNGTDWANVTAGNIVAATYQNDNFASAANNVNVVSANGAWNGTTVNTLRFATGTPTLTLSGTNTLTSGGILVASGSGAVTIGGAGSLAGAAASGTVASPIVGELGIFQNSASVLTISAPIVNSAAGLSFVTATPTGTTLNKLGTGTLVLSSAKNAYTGGTNIAYGILRLGASEVLPDGAAQQGAVSISSTATLDLAGFSETINGLTGTGVVDNTSATAATLYIGSANATSTFSGILQNTGAPAGLALTKVGTGTITLNGANTYGGATTINMGTLTLNFTLAGAPASNIISSSSALGLGSGTLTITGSTTANTQSFNGTTLFGGARVTQSGTTPALTVNLGAITRTANTGATLNVTTISPGVVTTSNANDSTGILGGWAVVNSADFATVNGSNQIVAYAGYTAVAAATGAGNTTQNALFNSGASISAGTVDYNTVKLAAAPTFSVAGNILRLGAVGAILLPTGGAAATIGSAAGNGVITAGGSAIANNPGELNLINWSSNALTINSVIANNGTGAVTLVKSGTGGVTLAGTNTYTGGTIINGGTLSITSSSQISSGGVTLNGGTLSFNADASLTPVFTLGAGGGTLTLAGISGGDRNYGATGNIGTTGTGPRTFTITGGGDNRRHILQSNLIDGAGGSTSLVLSFTGDSRTLRLGGTNTYTGTTLITRGVLDFAAVTGISGGITSAATVGNIIFGATSTSRAILQNSVTTPVALTRSLGYGDGQIHWEGNGGFSNNSANTTWAINLGGSGQTLVWGGGGFVPTGSILQFGVNSVTNSVTNLGGVDFQNGIDLGNVVRTIDTGSANDKQGTNPFDVILSGDLISSAGGGFNKTGAGAMVLTGNNSTSTTTSVTLTAGALIFEDLNAIPGTGANITLSTTAGGNSAIGLAGDTNPIATWASRIANASTATGAFALGADSSVDLDFTAFPNMRLAAFAYILPNKAITYTGRITPANSTYLLGGTAFAGDSANGLSTSLVLANRNALTGVNALNMSYGNVILLSANDFTGGTIVDGNAIGESAIGLGSNAALGTGNIALNGTQTKAFGAINGDRLVANNINWAGSGTSWVMGGDAANDGLSGTSNGGGMTYLGTIAISNSASAPTILSRTSHQVILLGNVSNGALTTGLTYNVTTLGVISSLATAANGGVAKTYGGTSFVNDATTLVIDHNDALGNSTNSLRLGSGTSTAATLRIQPGTTAVTLGVDRSVVMRGDSSQVIQVGRGSTLTINGVISSSGTNTAARTFTKSDNGILVLTNKNTYAGASSNANSLIIRGGTLRLDSSTGNFAAAADRFFADASNPLAIAFSAASGTYAGGATLEIIQGSGNAFALSQGFGNLTFNTGANTISLVNNSATQALTLNLGATFTRTALLGATVNFVTASAGGTNTIGSTNVGANGIIGGYATFNGLDWATGSGSAITALSAYTPSLPASGSTAAGNYLQTGGQTITTTQTINSLKFAPTGGAQTITVNSGVTQTVTSGGLLYDNTGGSATITGAGTYGAAGAEVIVHTYGSGDITVNKLTLSGVIKGTNTAISKSGPGTLVLAGTNSYTGALIINAGVVEYANGSATGQNLGSPTAGAGNILLNGGILRQTVTNNLIFGITVNGFSTIDVPSTIVLTQSAQGVTGKAGVTAILQKTGAGTLTFSGTSDNPSLSLDVTNGVVNLSKTSSATVHSVGVASGSSAAANFGAALLIGSGATVNITGAGTGNDQIHDQSSVVVRAGGIFSLGGGSATAESFDSLAGTGSVTNNNLTGTFTLTLGAGNNVNISAYSVAAADAGVSATGLNNFGGVISDGGAGKVIALTKTGSGIQILSGLNTYSGVTTISAGTLQMGIANALPSGVGKGNINIVGNGYGAATINGSTSIGTADKVLAPGTLDMGGFNQAINGLNSTTGGYVLNNPTLSWNGSAWVAAASSNILTVGNADANGSFNGTLADGYTVAPGVTTAVAYVGTLGLTKTGTGTQVLSGANTYLGVTTITGGTLQFGRSVSLYNAVTSNWTATNLVVNSGTVAAFNVGGAGEFTSSQIDIIAALGTGSGGFLSGSRIAFDTTNSTGAFVYNTAIANTNSGSNTIGVIKSGTGTLQLGGSSSYTGGTFITAGTLRAMSNAALGATNGIVTITNNATLQAGASFDTGASRAVAVGAGGARIDTNGNNVVVGGAISGSTSLQKDGAGKLDLNGAGANSFSGGVTVNAGTLAVNTNLSNASMTVQSGATLGGSGTVGAVTVQSGGTVAPGNSHGILTTADFDLKSGAHLSLEIGLPVAGDANGFDQVHATPVTTGVSLAGDLKITLFTGYTDTPGAIGSVYAIILNSSALPTTGTFSNTLSPQGWIASEDGLHFFSVNYAANVDGGNNDVTLTLQAVPEPGTWSLLVASFGLSLGLQRFRRRR